MKLLGMWTKFLANKGRKTWKLTLIEFCASGAVNKRGDLIAQAKT
jgi:hypothetical protein